MSIHLSQSIPNKHRTPLLSKKIRPPLSPHLPTVKHSPTAVIYITPATHPTVPYITPACSRYVPPPLPSRTRHPTACSANSRPLAHKNTAFTSVNGGEPPVRNKTMPNEVRYCYGSPRASETFLGKPFDYKSLPLVYPRP